MCLLLFILRDHSYSEYIKTVDIPYLDYYDCENYSIDIHDMTNVAKPSALSAEDTT